jgi:DNA-binding NarL/FixJ family response regulator
MAVLERTRDERPDLPVLVFSLSKGLSLTRIADVLSVSVKTVSTCRARVMEKLGLPSNAQLIRCVPDHKLG